MSGEPDFLRKKYAPLLDKTLPHALAHRLGKEFPRLGGPRILALCAEMILEVIAEHLRPLESLTHGQVLWLGISLHDPPTWRKRTAETDLVPVVLDLSTPQDVQAILQRHSPRQRLLAKSLRLCEQAYRQGALLSNCDLAELLTTHDSRIASLLAEHERKTETVVPRRATVHDVGTGLTHKRIICWKRYAEGKPSDQIARETYHSLEAVDRYLGQFDRVRHCRQQGLTPQQTAYTLNCTLSLVEQYLRIDQDLEAARA
jgi:DNA-binding CsgD family transcriptional regulator